MARTNGLDPDPRPRRRLVLGNPCARLSRFGGANPVAQHKVKVGAR